MTDTTAAAPRLGLGPTLAYGVGSMVQGVGAVTLSASTITFYLVAVVGMPAPLVGAVISASLVIDAIIDPLIGRFSDTFRSKWGRRHPFMYASVIPIAAATILLWWRPPGLSGEAIATYILVTLVVLRLANGIYQIPSDALTPELAPDYHQRTTLISVRWFFGVAAAVALGLALGWVFLRADKTHTLGQYDPAAYMRFGVTAAVIAVAAILTSAIATHRYIPTLAKPPQRRQSPSEAGKEIVTLLSNRSLLIVMGSGLISGVAGGISTALTSFMSYFFWGLTPQIASSIGSLAALVAIVGLVLAPILSRRFDKKPTMLAVFILSIFTGIVPVALRLMGLAPPNGSPLIPVLLVADAVVAATLALIGFVIIGSMVSDVVEDAAVKTGIRAEGLLFAANGLVPKITTGVGLLIGTLMISAVHLQIHVDAHGVHSVAPEAIRNLALISMPAGAVLNTLAVAVLAFYKLDRSSHEANLEALRLAVAVTEPPTSLPGGGTLIEPDPLTPRV